MQLVDIHCARVVLEVVVICGGFVKVVAQQSRKPRRGERRRQWREGEEDERERRES